MDLTLEKSTAIPELRALLLRRENSARRAIFRNKKGTETEARGLKNADGVAVCEAVVPHGMRFDEHTHNAETEVIIVYRGTLVYREGHIKRILTAGKVVSIEAGIAHSVEAVDGDAYVIAVTVPPSEAFPNGP